MDPDNEDAYDAEPLRCHSCRAIHRGSAALADRDPDPLAGIRWEVTHRGSTNGHVH